MDEFDITLDDFKTNSSFDLLSTPFIEIEFINPILDITINPDDFIEWLRSENQLEGETYKEMVGNMCEYSCLYISMLFCFSKLKGVLKVQCGNFGFWEHYWCEYHINNKVYIIDLTLQQFIPDAPKLAISEAKYHKNGYYITDSNIVDYSTPIKDYCIEKGAFKYYTIPKPFKK